VSLTSNFQLNTKFLLMLNKDKNTGIFVVVDDFCKKFRTEIKAIKLNL